MGKNDSSGRSRDSDSDSSFKDFKNFHVPKVFKGLFLVSGLFLGVALTAFIKNTLTEYYETSIADSDVNDDVITRETPSRPRTRPEKPKGHAPRLAPPSGVASATQDGARGSARKVPVAAPKVVERAVVQAAPVVASASPVSESKPLPKLVNIGGLSYDRATFVACSEDCTMSLRSRSGQSMKVKLKKSQFMASMDQDNSRIDIEGYVTDDRSVRVESVKAYPRRDTASTSPPTEMFPDENDTEAKVRKPVREEFDNIKDSAVADVEPKPKASRVQPQSLKSRLEASTGSGSKPAPSEDNGGSFQDRLKRSTR